MGSNHFEFDFSVTAFLIDNYVDEHGRILSCITLSGTDPKGKLRRQVMYTEMFLDEILDICDDPYEVAYSGK
jgi:hypothetical protein